MGAVFHSHLLYVLAEWDFMEIEKVGVLGLRFSRLPAFYASNDFDFI